MRVVVQGWSYPFLFYWLVHEHDQFPMICLDDIFYCFIYVSMINFQCFIYIVYFMITLEFSLASYLISPPFVICEEMR